MIWKASLSSAWYDGDIQLVACLVHDTLVLDIDFSLNKKKKGDLHFEQL